MIFRESSTELYSFFKFYKETEKLEMTSSLLIEDSKEQKTELIEQK